MPGPLEVTDPAEGSVNWKAAREHMLGRAADGEDQAGEGAGSTEQEFREFKYRGKTLRVDADTYEVLAGLNREARGANGKLGAELAQTRERLARLEGATARQVEDRKPEDDIKPPDPLLATKDIAAWQAQYDAYHTAKMAQQAARLEEKYMGAVREVNDRVQTAQRDAKWAEGFYSSYDHLDHPDIKPIVSQVYQENFDEIKNLEGDLEGQYDRLAELADARILRLRRVGTETDNDTEPKQRRRPRLESSAGPTPRGKTEDKPREFSAASWVARQRLKMNGREPKK
jgi:hypothetical protein